MQAQAIDVGSMRRVRTLPNGNTATIECSLENPRDQHPNAHEFFRFNVNVHIDDELEFSVVPSLDTTDYSDQLVPVVLVLRAPKKCRDADYYRIECYSDPLVRYDPPSVMRAKYELHATYSTRSISVPWKNLPWNDEDDSEELGVFEAWGFKFQFEPHIKKLTIFVQDGQVYQENPIVIYYDQLVDYDTTDIPERAA